jgi:phosphohistidine swiveling domain-containing protein
MNRADIFLIYKDGVYNTFINRKKEKICLQYGLRLYKNKKLYDRYYRDFKAHVKKANTIVIPKYSVVPKKMTKKEFSDLAKFLGKFWYYYGMVEYAYLDLAFEWANAHGDKKMMQRLKEISTFKFKAREVLNAFFFKNGVTQNVLTSISRDFLTDYKAKYLYLDELLDVFSGKIVDPEIIKGRGKCYAAASIDGKTITFSLKEALKFDRKFNSISQSRVLKGVVANPGKTQGRAVIAPMLNDYKLIAEINRRMKKGDILVAETTSPDIMILCKKASAIVADQGGMLSHAAVVSRELNIPCVIQTERATRVIKDGDVVEVDAYKGIVKVINK